MNIVSGAVVLLAFWALEALFIVYSYRLYCRSIRRA